MRTFELNLWIKENCSNFLFFALSLRCMCVYSCLLFVHFFVVLCSSVFNILIVCKFALVEIETKYCILLESISRNKKKTRKRYMMKLRRLLLCTRWTKFSNKLFYLPWDFFRSLCALCCDVFTEKGDVDNEKAEKNVPELATPPTAGENSWNKTDSPIKCCS